MDSACLDQLLARARKHDADALAELVDAYSPRVFGLLLRLTRDREMAEDLMQETFLRLVRTIGSYEHEGRFEAWLFRIAGNLARDHARRNKRRGRPLSLDAPTGASGEDRIEPADTRPDGPTHQIARDEDEQRLLAALDEIGETDREIVMLRHFSELSFREIAELLNVPLGTALARMHRALKKLRTLLEPEG